MGIAKSGKYGIIVCEYLCLLTLERRYRMNNNLSYKEFIERHERERREYAKRHGLDYNSYYHIKPPAEEQTIFVSVISGAKSLPMMQKRGTICVVFASMCSSR